MEAYQAFLLGGGKSPPPTPSSPHLRTPHQTPGNQTPRTGGGSSTKKKRTKPFKQGLRGRAEDWKDADAQLEQVVGSIANLRDRIWWEQGQLVAMEEDGRPKAWKDMGYRKSGTTDLLKEDVRLALAHDLLQHERMLAACRKLIASLAQAQEAMGRRLDEWMTTALEDYDRPPEEVREEEDAQELYVFLAEELYRKQRMVQELLDSCHDGMLVPDATENLREPGNPRSVARRCSDRWVSKDQEMIAVWNRVLGKTNS